VPLERIAASAKCRGINRTLGILICLLLISAAHGRADQNKPTFNGVTTTFSLIRPRIKTDQKLKVRFVFDNTGPATTIFRFFEPSVNARLYSRGRDLGLLCPEGDHLVFAVTLKPGKKFESTNELFITRCYHLAPGRYSIRFNYNLRLGGDRLRQQAQQAERQTGSPIVPWDGRHHTFTVVK
jgi:hypothetical protein